MAGTSQEWELGRQVGMLEGRIREQERIIAMLNDIELSTIDPQTQEVAFIEMDWTDFIEEIRGGESL